MSKDVISTTGRSKTDLESQYIDLLMVAATNRDLVGLKQLLDNNQYSEEILVDTLSAAVTQPDAEQVISLLLKAGAPLDCEILKSAVLAETLDNVQFLINQNCPVNQDSLITAIQTNQLDALELLTLAKRVDPDMSVSPIELAIKEGRWDMVDSLRVFYSRTSVAANMNGDLTELSVQDLLQYPEADLRLLAKQMDIGRGDIKGVAREIARKLIYAHSETLPETNGKCARYTKKLDPEALDEIRAQIYDEFSRFSDSVSTMGPSELSDLFKRYDELCFDNDIQGYMQKVKYSLSFKINGEETFTTEGICIHKVCNYTITIPIHFFDRVNGITNVAGHLCKDQLECLLRVMEHEMVHLIIFMFCGDTFITDQHGALFMNMVKDLFGHTDHRHYIF